MTHPSAPIRATRQPYSASVVGLAALARSASQSEPRRSASLVGFRASGCLRYEPARRLLRLTGTNRERPGLREALAACRAGDTLVVTKLDRQQGRYLTLGPSLTS